MSLPCQQETRHPLSAIPPEVQNYLYLQGHHLRFAVDGPDTPLHIQYPTVSNGVLDFHGATYTLRTPGPEDQRVIEVHFNVHPDEKHQTELGISLLQDPLEGVYAYDVNSLAGQHGIRKVAFNMNLHAPGRHDTPPDGELGMLWRKLQSVAFRNPDCAFETHNTPVEGDASILMRRDVPSYVGRVAAFLSTYWDVPLIEAPPSMFSGYYGRSLLLEMEPNDERFAIPALRTVLADLAANKLKLPDQPGKPSFSFRRELTGAECRAVKIPVDSHRQPLELLPDQACRQLGLPPGSRTTNWLGPLLPAVPGVIVVPFTATSHPPRVMSQQGSHWSVSRPT